MLVVWFHATLLQRLGSGPLWHSTVGRDVARCRAGWWRNLLFSNNYGDHNHQYCLLVSWHLAVDTQMFLVCLPLVYALCRRPWLGRAVLASLFALSVLVPFLVVWIGRHDALVLPILENIEDLPSSRYMQEVYVRTENRAAPHLIGVVAALVMVRFRQSHFRINKAWSLAGLVLLKAAAVGTMLCAYPLYAPGWERSQALAALYAALSPVLFAAAHAGVVLLLCFGSLGNLKKILTWRPFRILGKLTYGANLVHTLAQVYYKGTLRVQLPTDVFTFLWMAAGDAVFSFATSFLLWLLLEAPARALGGLVFGQRAASRRHKTS
ncbi:nose resistant to fluoxetine protein 6-like [Bacillus rossius redtenbacheri]|uniref:nose resistant to fluoxetine protein 6-like n=1 Tax=Bacillus rossius redtenbacheri TaxID=93214 RepID=UPI002FDECFFB